MHFSPSGTVSSSAARLVARVNLSNIIWPSTALIRRTPEAGGGLTVGDTWLLKLPVLQVLRLAPMPKHKNNLSV